jgi:adenosylhomocysteine nucleosidase
MKIGIIVAMDKELQQLRQVFDGSDVLVEKCGIGKVNAALGAQRMISDFRPDCIISSGCAGGHGADIEVRSTVVSTHLAYHDVYCGTAIDNSTQYGQVQGLPARFQADPYLLKKAIELRDGGSEAGRSIKAGLIVTGDWFVDSREKMAYIVSKFPDARAVDMESAAIAHTCYLSRVPFISFRVISDMPLSDNHAQQYHDFWAQVAAQSFMLTRTFVESL